MDEPHQPDNSAQAQAAAAGKAVLLVAKSAFAAAPHAEMRRLALMASLLPGVAKAWLAIPNRVSHRCVTRCCRCAAAGMGRS